MLPVGARGRRGHGVRLPGGPPDRATRCSTTAFTDLDRDADGVATAVLRDPATGTASRCGWTGTTGGCRSSRADDLRGSRPRGSLAVEPMTAPADAFRTGEDLVTLAPAGEPGDELSVSWGVRALD